MSALWLRCERSVARYNRRREEVRSRLRSASKRNGNTLAEAERAMRLLELESASRFAFPTMTSTAADAGGGGGGGAAAAAAEIPADLKLLAFAMGTHERLGASSAVRLLKAPEREAKLEKKRGGRKKKAEELLKACRPAPRRSPLAPAHRTARARRASRSRASTRSSRRWATTRATRGWPSSSSSTSRLRRRPASRRQAPLGLLRSSSRDCHRRSVLVGTGPEMRTQLQSLIFEKFSGSAAMTSRRVTRGPTGASRTGCAARAAARRSAAAGPRRRRREAEGEAARLGLPRRLGMGLDSR